MESVAKWAGVCGLPGCPGSLVSVHDPVRHDHEEFVAPCVSFWRHKLTEVVHNKSKRSCQVESCWLQGQSGTSG